MSTRSPINTNDPAPNAPHVPVPPPTSDESKGETGGNTAVAERAAMPKPKVAPPRVDHLPPFKVLLHNDPHNIFEDVIDTIVELTPHPRPRAVELTNEAHRTGVTLLLVTHRERAELYREQFASKRLTVSIEPAA